MSPTLTELGQGVDPAPLLRQCPKCLRTVWAWGTCTHGEKPVSLPQAEPVAVDAPEPVPPPTGKRK